MLGATCLFVAAKFYEREDDVPGVHDLVYMGDRAFSHQAVLNAEVKLVHSLGFELQAVTPLSFLHLYCDVLQVHCGTEPRVFWLAVMLIELSLLRTSTLRLRASVAAAAALYVAVATRVGAGVAVDMWNGSLYLICGLTPLRAPLSTAITAMQQLRLNPPTVPGEF